MNRHLVVLLGLILFPWSTIPVGADTTPQKDKPAIKPMKVYGEWRIRVRPDKGAAYRKLIETKGLPLFRKAGGRMVGWWNTQVGNLYEQVTIWEYDSMAAFDRAGQILGKDEAFARFVERRDPLLSGEESRFLRLTPFAARPQLPDSARVVIHEIHRVPRKGMADYLAFMEKDGLPILKKHGFRPVGPWVVDVGRWTEVTFLFRFDSLADREQRIARFAAHPDVKTYAKIDQLVDDITTRVLTPTPFAAPVKESRRRPVSSRLLPHLAELAPGVFVAGFADRFGDANCGLVALRDATLLVDLPHGVDIPAFLKEVVRLTGKPVRKLALTHLGPDDVSVIESLIDHGVKEVAAPSRVTRRLQASKKVAAVLRPVYIFDIDVGDPSNAPSLRYLGDRSSSAKLLYLDGILPGGAGAVYLPLARVLFAGPLVAHGPRTRLAGTNTAPWLKALARLEELEPALVVPGFGSLGGPEVLRRQRRYLTELRRQVSYVIARGRPRTDLATEVRLPSDYLVWMPYDTPLAEDIVHVYRELTAPAAPFNGHPPARDDSLPHALVLIGDEPHEPGHIEEGLRPVFEATNVVPHFTVDVKCLSADNLAKVRLLVLLRDGLQRPHTGPKCDYVWMTPEQERAVVKFVEAGGGVLCLHNSLGLYPEGGPYLKMMGGRYTGHGPLERFRVEVTDAAHPVTRGVQAFTVADEQHTPEPIKGKTHLLLQSRSDAGKTAVAGWVVEAGAGRVCYLAPGHTREALLHPMYQRLMRNGVRWCLHLDRAKAKEPKEPAAKDRSLRHELLAMMKEDQRIRKAVLKEMARKGASPLHNQPITDPAVLKVIQDGARRMADVDKKTLSRMKEIVDRYGWPGKTLVGTDGAHAAWLLVQHADTDRAFQERCLKLMKAAPRGEVDLADIAYLTDRVLVGQKRKQVYGTQLVGDRGVFKPQPIEDEANVDKRRAQVGLRLLAEYLKTAQAVYQKGPQKEPAKKESKQ
jgi:type 1 glutamine amidotransferase